MIHLTYKDFVDQNKKMQNSMIYTIIPLENKKQVGKYDTHVVLSLKHTGAEPCSKVVPIDSLGKGYYKLSNVSVLKNWGGFIREPNEQETVMSIQALLHKDVLYKQLEESEKFNKYQLQQIKEGLDAGIDIFVYAKPQYDVRQMREIRLGLQHRIDVTPYLKNYPSKLMECIRLSIENHYDWNPLLGFKEDCYPILSACLRDEDICKYVTKDFNAKQILVVSKGLTQKVDVTVYNNSKYSADDMQFILDCLSCKVDITKLCDVKKLDKAKKVEIKKWVEIGLDISEYINLSTVELQGKYYEITKGHSLNWYKQRGFKYDQLYEILEGLKSGVKVGKYAKKELTAEEMRKIRLKLEHKKA